MLNPSVFAAGRYIPLPVAEPPVGMNFVALAVPVVARFVPSNVSAVPLANVVVPLAYTMPLAVQDAFAVPPRATDSVPVQPNVSAWVAIDPVTLVSLVTDCTTLELSRPAASVPVHPSVNEVAARSEVVGEPPSVNVTLVSSVFVNAAEVTAMVGVRPPVEVIGAVALTDET